MLIKSRYKRFLAIASTALLLLASTPVSATSTEAPLSQSNQTTTLTSGLSVFSDVPEKAWYAETVNAWVNLGLLDPSKGDKLHPQEQMTRGSFATYLAVALGLTPSTSNYPYSDLSPNTELTGYVSSLYELGLVSGYPDGTFRPNAQITRAEVASFIVKAKKYVVAPEYAKQFTDVKQGSWYDGLVGALAQAGIANGKTSTTFAPSANITIAEGITFIDRAFYTLPTIQEINDNGTIKIQGKNYSIAPAIKGVFQTSNKAALIGASISFTSVDGEVKSIEELIIGYKYSNKAENSPLLFDGDGAVINGNLIIDTDHVMMSRLTINNHLILTHKVVNNFFAYGVVVKESTTFLKDNARDKEMMTNLWFDNSDLGLIQLFNSAKVRNFDLKSDLTANVNKTINIANLSSSNSHYAATSLALTNYHFISAASSFHEGVQSLYVAYFSRSSDAESLEHWDNVLAGNIDIDDNKEDFEIDVANSQSLYGGLSFSPAVDTIYQNLFGRDTEPAALNFWASIVESGVAIDEVSSDSQTELKLDIENIDSASIDVDTDVEISAGPSTTLSNLSISSGSEVNLLSNTPIEQLTIGSSNNGENNSTDTLILQMLMFSAMLVRLSLMLRVKSKNLGFLKKFPH
jgi:hypothetical protein